MLECMLTFWFIIDKISNCISNDSRIRHIWHNQPRSMLKNAISSHKLQSNIGLQATTEDIKTKAACDAQICWNTHISFFSWVFRLVQFFRIAKAVFEFMFSSN